jgi:hypothetical protein
VEGPRDRRAIVGVDAAGEPRRRRRGRGPRRSCPCGRGRTGRPASAPRALLWPNTARPTWTRSSTLLLLSRTMSNIEASPARALRIWSQPPMARRGRAGAAAVDVEHRRGGVEQEHDAGDAGGADGGDDVGLDVDDDGLEGVAEGGRVRGVEGGRGAAGEGEVVGVFFVEGRAEGDDVGGDAQLGEQGGGAGVRVLVGRGEVQVTLRVLPGAVHDEHDDGGALAHVLRVVGSGGGDVVGGEVEGAAGPAADADLVAAGGRVGGGEGGEDGVAVAALEVGLLRDVGVVPGDVELLAVDEAGGVGGDLGAGDLGVGVVAVADEGEDEVFGDVAVVEGDGLGDRGVGGLPAGLVDAVHQLVHRARVVEEKGEERLLESAALLFLAGHRGGVDGGGGAVGEGEGEAGEESELGDVAGPGGERTLHRATVSVAETGAVGYWARRTK